MSEISAMKFQKFYVRSSLKFQRFHVTLRAEKKGEKEGKNKKKGKKKHTNFLISFVFVFQRKKTNDKPDEQEFYVL